MTCYRASRCVLSFLAVLAGVARGQGAATDQAVTLTYLSNHWTSSPRAMLAGTEPQLETGLLYEFGWWYRLDGDPREYTFPVPDTQTYSNGRVTAVWNNLHGKGLKVTEYTDVFDNERPAGSLRSTLYVANNGATTRTLTTFHYVDVNLARSAGGDVGQLASSQFMKFTDAADPGAVMRYRAFGAQHHQVGPYPGLRARLNDADLDELDDTGLPFGPGDASAAFQFRAQIPVGASQYVGNVSLSSRLPTDRVRGAYFDLGSYPALVTQDLDSGFHHAWDFRRTAWARAFAFLPVPAGFALVGVDDFDGDFHDERVVRSLTTGETRIGNWPIEGAASLAPDWLLASTGDFNNDGKADLLWRNVATQKLVVWLMDGHRRIGAVVPNPDQAADANWRLAGSEDFDGDGLRDLLWNNETSGNLVIWYLDGALTRTRAAFTSPASVGDAGWRVVAVGDYGKGAGGVLGSADIVWQNDNSRKLVVWHMDRGGVRTSGVFTSPDNLGTQRVVLGPR